MSVRRAAPLVTHPEALAVGALADRLPGATRLSQVLAAGGKHLAKHKTANTEAPGKRPIDGQVGFRQAITSPRIAAYVNLLKRLVQKILAAQQAGQISIGALQNMMHEAHSHVFRIAQLANSIDDMEVLRRMGAWFVLNWLFQHGSPQQSRNAELVLSEDLWGESDDGFDDIMGNPHQDGTFDADNVLGLAQGVNVLDLADAPALALAGTDRNGLAPYAPGPSEFNDRREAEKRQKVDVDREAKRRKKQKDRKTSPELEKAVDAREARAVMKDGQILPGTNQKRAQSNEAEKRRDAQGDQLGGGLGDDIGYGEMSEPSDDEEDENEGDPMAQQPYYPPPKKGK